MILFFLQAIWTLSIMKRNTGYNKMTQRNDYIMIFFLTQSFFTLTIEMIEIEIITFPNVMCPKIGQHLMFLLSYLRLFDLVFYPKNKYLLFKHSASEQSVK